MKRVSSDEATPCPYGQVYSTKSDNTCQSEKNENKEHTHSPTFGAVSVLLYLCRQDPPVTGQLAQGIPALFVDLDGFNF